MSKRCTELTERLNPHPSFARRSFTAARAYSSHPALNPQKPWTISNPSRLKLASARSAHDLTSTSGTSLPRISVTPRSRPASPSGTDSSTANASRRSDRCRDSRTCPRRFRPSHTRRRCAPPGSTSPRILIHAHAQNGSRSHHPRHSSRTVTKRDWCPRLRVAATASVVHPSDWRSPARLLRWSEPSVLVADGYR